MNWDLGASVVLFLIYAILSLEHLDNRTDLIPIHFSRFFFFFSSSKNVKYKLQKTE